MIGRYHNAPYGSLPPHCFQEAEDAFSSLQKTRRNQAVVICGESGAGKTETTKLMLHYLAVVSKRQSARDAKLKGTTQHSGPTIAERMVASGEHRARVCEELELERWGLDEELLFLLLRGWEPECPLRVYPLSVLMFSNF